MFQALTPQITTTFSLQLSTSLSFNDIEQRSTDVIIEGGKALKFTSLDPGWCDISTKLKLSNRM